MTDRLKAKGLGQVNSEKDLKQFILDVVNDHDEPNAGSKSYFFRHHSTFLPSISNRTALIPLIANKISHKKPLNDLLPDELYAAIIAEIRDGMQKIWEAEDEYSAEWVVFTLQLTLDKVMQADGRHNRKKLHPPPLDEPIQKALQWMRVNFHTLRKCSNPKCVTPYFSVSRGKQQYCSAECSAVGQSKVKRQWWSEKGPEWREAKRKQRITNKKLT